MIGRRFELPQPPPPMRGSGSFGRFVAHALILAFSGPGGRGEDKAPPHESHPHTRKMNTFFFFLLLVFGPKTQAMLRLEHLH